MTELFSGMATKRYSYVDHKNYFVNNHNVTVLSNGDYVLGSLVTAKRDSTDSSLTKIQSTTWKCFPMGGVVHDWPRERIILYVYESNEKTTVMLIWFYFGVNCTDII